MTDKDKFEEEQEESQNSKKSADIWYKLRSVGGIATAVMVAVIGSTGSYLMNKRQVESTRAQLYTQLMSQRENAESSVRKDMFQQILSSFLTTPTTGSVCILEQIDEELLRLELLARNFHEMLDMEPLFLHVLLKIVGEIPKLPEPSLSPDMAENSTPASSNDRLYALWQQTPGNLEWKDFKRKVMRRKLDRLIRIANRITKKQIESLSSVERRQRLTIDLTKTCQKTRPTEHIDTECAKTGAVKEPTFAMQLEGGVKRQFTVSVDHSFPMWNQVRVKVAVQKTVAEQKADPNGQNVHLSQFWLSYFDFPLAENTFLSEKERYAIVLDEIDSDKNKAVISVLYFPASYAGLKEKSFYQQKLISTLLDQQSF